MPLPGHFETKFLKISPVSFTLRQRNGNGFLVLIKIHTRDKRAVEIKYDYINVIYTHIGVELHALEQKYNMTLGLWYSDNGHKIEVV